MLINIPLTRIFGTGRPGILQPVLYVGLPRTKYSSFGDTVEPWGYDRWDRLSFSFGDHLSAGGTPGIAMLKNDAHILQPDFWGGLVRTKYSSFNDHWSAGRTPRIAKLDTNAHILHPVRWVVLSERNRGVLGRWRNRGFDRDKCSFGGALVFWRSP